MTAPPGSTPIPEPRVEQISAESETELSTRTRQMRLLVERLGISRWQAHALLRAYEHDLADAIRIGNSGRQSDLDFLAWVMQQRPLDSKPKPRRRHWRVGEGGGLATR